MFGKKLYEGEYKDGEMHDKGTNDYINGCR